MTSDSTDEANYIATVKILIVWIATFFGSITLNQVMVVCTIVFTLLQIFMLLRRLWKGLP